MTTVNDSPVAIIGPGKKTAYVGAFVEVERLNVDLVERLTSEGRMQPAGLAAVELAKTGIGELENGTEWSTVRKGPLASATAGP